MEWSGIDQDAGGAVEDLELGQLSNVAEPIILQTIPYLYSLTHVSRMLSRKVPKVSGYAALYVYLRMNFLELRLSSYKLSVSHSMTRKNHSLYYILSPLILTV